ncbi:MAG TPA: hypothetical protein VH592_15490 [Gemmataceae bacterium]|jgi:hypothetical protein
MCRLYNRLIQAFVAGILYFGGLTPGVAQPKEEMEPKYVEVTSGIKVLRPWETVGPAWPQIAIIELSLERHREFHDDPVAAFNK